MCARRFLILIFILTLIFVGGSFAIYQWGGNALIRMATPVGHFRMPPQNDAPDYNKDWGTWVDRPELRVNPSSWAPRNDAEQSSMEDWGAAVTFYVHPTTYLARDRWNAPIVGAETPVVAEQQSRDRAELFVRSQASAFSPVGPVWAPKYRQAAYGAFLLNSEDADQALNLAYRDVLSAFDLFLAEQPKDKPIILAGHSQGSLQLLRLLEDRRDALRGRLVAAYVVGWPVGMKADLPATGLPACEAPDQTACVLSWQSFKEPDNVSLITDAWVGTTGLTGVKRTRQDMLCTNPLTGTKDGAAPASANKGTLVTNGNFSEASMDAGRVGARCDRGFLLIDGDIPNLGPYVLPGNNYHVYDYALFWGSIRADAEQRLAAWHKR